MLQSCFGKDCLKAALSYVIAAETDKSRSIYRCY